MRRDAVLSLSVHLIRADLELHRLAERPDHRGVQRLIHRELRHRDVILEPAGYRVPSRVDDAESRVAIANGIDQYTDPDEVVDVIKVPAAHDHLLIDAVVMLRTSANGGIDMRPAQVVLDLVDDLLELRVAFRRAFRHKADDLLVPLRIEVLERKVFEFELDGVHAKPVRQWGEDLERLARLRFALCLRHGGECSHVVQPVGQLDDENADVARHGDHHLANRLSRACFAVFHLVEFRHAIDKMPYFLAEVLGQLLQRVRGVLDSVVQQCGDDRRRRHAEIGENAGNSQWVGDVGLATAPRLPLVEFRSGLEGPPDDSGVTLRVELVDRLDERVEIGSEVEFDRRSPLTGSPDMRRKYRFTRS